MNKKNLINYYSNILYFCFFPSLLLFLSQGYGADIYDHFIYSKIYIFDKLIQPVWNIKEFYIPRYIFFYDYLAILWKLYIPPFLFPVLLGAFKFYYLYKWKPKTKIGFAFKNTLVFSSLPLLLYLSASRISLIFLVLALLNFYLYKNEKLFFVFIFISATTSLAGLLMVILSLIYIFRKSIKRLLFYKLLLFLPIVLNNYFYKNEYLTIQNNRRDFIYLFEFGKEKIFSVGLNRFEDILQIFILISLLYIFFKFKDTQIFIKAFNKIAFNLVVIFSIIIFIYSNFFIKTISSRPFESGSSKYDWEVLKNRKACNRLISKITFLPLNEKRDFINGLYCNKYG